MLVASAHNMPVESYPWRFSSVISVGSHEGTDSWEWYANPDPPVEFFARGIDIDVAWAGGSTLRCTGNSFAAPHIAGLSALVLSKHPELTPFQLKSVLYLTASNTGGDRMTDETGYQEAVAAGMLPSEESHRALLQSIVDVARAIFGAKASSIFLLDAETDELVFEAVSGEGEGELIGMRIPVEHRHRRLGARHRPADRDRRPPAGSALRAPGGRADGLRAGGASWPCRS